MEDRLKQPWVVCTEVNITAPSYDMSSAIKEYDSGSSASMSMSASANMSIPNLNPVSLALAPSPPASPLSQQKPPLPTMIPAPTQILPPNNPKLVSAIAAGGSSHEFDNKKELKDYIKMFKKQNRKSYKTKNSNTRRNKKNDKSKE